MSISFLIMLAVLGLLVVGGIAALCFQRTRPLGYALLLLPVALLAFAAFHMFGFAALGGAARASRVMFGMPVVMLLVGGGIAALVALLANRRTRPVGYVLLAVPVVLGGLAVVAGLFLYPVTVHHKEIRQYGQTTQTRPQAPPVERLAVAPPERKEQREERAVDDGLDAEKAVVVAEPASGLDGRETAESIVQALAVAFGQTLFEREESSAKESAAAKTTGETKQSDAKNTENSGDDQINKMVEVLSDAVQEELPDDVEIDQFIALRALGKLLGRMIASEKEDNQAIVAKPASGLDRPAWVEAAAGRVGDGYQIVFVAGPYTTRLECDQAMPEQLDRAVAEYAALYLGGDKARRVTLPVSFLRDHVIRDQWEETFQSSVGPMVRVHTRLLFDGRTNDELKAGLRRSIVEERLWIAGGGLTGLLAVIFGLFGVLKFDHATGGRYRGRMVFALFFVGLAVVVGVWTPWGRIANRPATEPVEATVTHDASVPISYVIRKKPPGTENMPMRRSGGGPSVSWAGIFILSAAPLSCLTTGLLIFKKSRVFGLLLIFMGVAVALWTLILVA